MSEANTGLPKKRWVTGAHRVCVLLYLIAVATGLAVTADSIDRMWSDMPVLAMGQ